MQVNFHHLSNLRLETIAGCPNCYQGPMIFDTSGGEVLCSNCGTVIEEKMRYDDPLWRSLITDMRGNSRTDTSSSNPGYKLDFGTSINSSHHDASGRRLSRPAEVTLKRLRSLDNRSKIQGNSGRSLHPAFREIRKLADKMGLGELAVNRALCIYRKALRQGFTRGRALPTLVPAILYASCREIETPRTLKDFAQASTAKKREIAQFFRQLYTAIEFRMPIANPSKFVSKVASNTHLSEKVKRRALEIIRIAQDSGNITGKYPMSIVASALYLAANLEGENVSQKDLARHAGITEVTIRNRCRGLRTTLESNHKP